MANAARVTISGAALSRIYRAIHEHITELRVDVLHGRVTGVSVTGERAVSDWLADQVDLLYSEVVEAITENVK